ncbi:putative membrane protein [Helicobacter pylori R055a]|nr:putative membrane protein [Helicobacter pylori R055a]
MNASLALSNQRDKKNFYLKGGILILFGILYYIVVSGVAWYNGLT